MPKPRLQILLDPVLRKDPHDSPTEGALLLRHESQSYIAESFPGWRHSRTHQFFHARGGAAIPVLGGQFITDTSGLI